MRCKNESLSFVSNNIWYIAFFELHYFSNQRKKISLESYALLTASCIILPVCSFCIHVFEMADYQLKHLYRFIPPNRLLYIPSSCSASFVQKKRADFFSASNSLLPSLSNMRHFILFGYFPFLSIFLWALSLCLHECERLPESGQKRGNCL